MIPSRIFTKAFFRMHEHDQGLTVAAILRELENAVGSYLNPDDDRKARQRIKRIRARAARHGFTVRHQPTAKGGTYETSF